MISRMMRISRSTPPPMYIFSLLWSGNSLLITQPRAENTSPGSRNASRSLLPCSKNQSEFGLRRSAFLTRS